MAGTHESTRPQPPRLTVIVAFYEMRREAERTLHTLTADYQRGVSADDYEVVAVDNGSTDPLREEDVERFGPNFRFVLEREATSSPAAAINRIARESRSEAVMCLIDGARMLSPGIVAGARGALAEDPDAFVYTVSMHVGPENQNALVARGWTTEDEDELLAGVDWRGDGYRLFGVSSFASSAPGGFFAPVMESNCFVLKRSTFLTAGGFEERFRSPGGGPVNPDLFKRMVESPAVRPVCLVGEATFHQLHGGVATNVPPDEHPGPSFAAEYMAVRGRRYSAPRAPRPLFRGEIPEQARELGPQRPPGRLAWRLATTSGRLRLARIGAANRLSPRRLFGRGRTSP